MHVVRLGRLGEEVEAGLAGQSIALAIVAGTAAGHDVRPGVPAPAGDGQDVVAGEEFVNKVKGWQLKISENDLGDNNCNLVNDKKITDEEPNLNTNQLTNNCAKSVYLRQSVHKSNIFDVKYVKEADSHLIASLSSEELLLFKT